MRTQTQACNFCNGDGEVQILQQTDNGPIMIMKDCPVCHETSESGEPIVYRFFDPTPNPNGRAASNVSRPESSGIVGGDEVLEPDEVIPASEMQLVDDHMEFHLKHVGRKTAAKQAGHLVASYRQKELDTFRAELAMKMTNELIALAAQYMQQLWDYMESSTAHHSPEVANRIEALTLKGMDFHSQLVEVAPRLYISRYGYR